MAEERKEIVAKKKEVPVKKEKEVKDVMKKDMTKKVPAVKKEEKKEIVRLEGSVEIIEDDGSLVALDETGEKTSVKVTASQADTYVPYEDFEGNYIFGFMDVDGDGSITNYPVTLELNEDGYSYTMPFAGFDISVGWTPYGYMTFNTQYLGLYQDLFVMMCPLSSSGFFSVSSETGYNIVPDMSGDGQVWMFEDNGAWDEIMCMMLYGFFDQQLNEQAGYLMRFIPGYLIKQ